MGTMGTVNFSHACDVMGVREFVHDMLLSVGGDTCLSWPCTFCNDRQVHSNLASFNALCSLIDQKQASGITHPLTSNTFL